MYPVFLNLAGKQCLVVGGGRVALRKVLVLLRADAAVIVVAKEACGRLRSIDHRITLHERPFEESDLNRSLSLVIGATDDESVNRTVSRLAAAYNIPCNIVDQPELCSFIVPAQVRRGDITVAISTGATAPRLSRYLKAAVAEMIGPMHGALAAYLKTVRKRIRSCIPVKSARNAFWEALFAVDPIKEITDQGWEALRSRTERLIDEYSAKGGGR
jgi:siroheme synthase-like protein